MNKFCKFNWFSTFVLHKTKTDCIAKEQNSQIKSNKVIECLKQLALYKNPPLTKDEIYVLDYTIRYVEENKKLREALQKCNPLKAGYCKFCLNDLLNNEHAEDCEYVRLTGGHNK
jgi:hypothetical protein